MAQPMAPTLCLSQIGQSAIYTSIVFPYYNFMKIPDKTRITLTFLTYIVFRFTGFIHTPINTMNQHFILDK